jgi:hypothetical protein
MSKKNVQFSDFTTANVAGVSLVAPGGLLYEFTAKRNGFVRVDVFLTVDLSASGAVDSLTCFGLENGGDLDGVFIYGPEDRGFLNGTMLLPVVKDGDYSIYGESTQGYDAEQGYVAITYLS